MVDGTIVKDPERPIERREETVRIPVNQEKRKTMKRLIQGINQEKNDQRRSTETN